MKKFIIIIITIVSTVISVKSQVIINSRYRPIPYEILIMEAQAKALENARREERFNELKEMAYDYYRKEDFGNFLLYSRYALDTGFYTATLYYDRGKVYEHYNSFKEAKKEYKKAQKVGHPYATQALEDCKQKEKEYKRLQKQHRR